MENLFRKRFPVTFRPMSFVFLALRPARQAGRGATYPGVDDT
jgi:hypothetical protein